MRYFLCFLTLLISSAISAQDDLYIADIQAIQAELNEHYTNPDTSILTPEGFQNFDGLEFYPIDSKYRIEARFVRTPGEIPFLMPTTTERTPEYVKYGEAHFTLDGKSFVLNLFKNIVPISEPGYENYLFLPFTDLTSGDGSYGGGRYLDQEIPEGDIIIIDFNKAYNPYCAYNPKYSCPIPPKENDMLIRVESGVKDFIQNLD